MERVRRRPRLGVEDVPGSLPRAAVHPVVALQRGAGNRAVAALLQRQLRHDPELDGVETSDDKLGGDVVDLETLVDAVLEAEIGFEGRRKEIEDALGAYATEGPPDLAYDEIDSVVAWLAGQGIKPSETFNRNAGTLEQDSSEEEEEEEEKPRGGRGGRGRGRGGRQTGSKRGAKKGGKGGEKIGERFFPGEEWHREVKPAIIATITKRKLRTISKDKSADNWNFWIERNGDIYCGPNSNKTSKGRFTGYRLTDDNDVELVEDVLGDEKGEQ
jgi:hypothetical protein